MPHRTSLSRGAVGVPAQLVSARRIPTAGVMLASGAYDAHRLSYEYWPYLPLVAFPEGFVNGMIITALVGLRAHWVVTFDEDFYYRSS